MPAQKNKKPVHENRLFAFRRSSSNASAFLCGKKNRLIRAGFLVFSR
jgi:hypothetical protein